MMNSRSVDSASVSDGVNSDNEMIPHADWPGFICHTIFANNKRIQISTSLYLCPNPVCHLRSSLLHDRHVQISTSAHRFTSALILSATQEVPCYTTGTSRSAHQHIALPLPLSCRPLKKFPATRQARPDQHIALPQPLSYLPLKEVPRYMTGTSRSAHRFKPALHPVCHLRSSLLHDRHVQISTLLYLSPYPVCHLRIPR